MNAVVGLIVRNVNDLKSVGAAGESAGQSDGSRIGGGARDKGLDGLEVVRRAILQVDRVRTRTTLPLQGVRLTSHNIEFGVGE